LSAIPTGHLSVAYSVELSSVALHTGRWMKSIKCTEIFTPCITVFFEMCSKLHKVHDL